MRRGWRSQTEAERESAGKSGRSKIMPSQKPSKKKAESRGDRGRPAAPESPVKCRINGREAAFPKGTTIIQAFKKLKADIAHYCWHPGLSVAGVCRLCMVEIEGQKKLQIACNTEIQEGMAISNQSEKVKEAVRWGLEYHLINHPLDCPICDQAGECSLQDQYMKFGAYAPSMSQAKVKKRKVVDLGSKIVLDTERCILCSRCVRFTEEVTKTHELGIFDRGDRSEIGVFKGRPLDNNYAMNTVDICPVGALTSKDFRFKQRVWYMKTADSVCAGCSAGCAIHADYNEEGIWRVRPRHNPKANGYWMCDKGRGLYKNANPENRLRAAMRGRGPKWEALPPLKALGEICRDMGWEKNREDSQAADEPDGGKAAAGPKAAGESGRPAKSSRQAADSENKESRAGSGHPAGASLQAAAAAEAKLQISKKAKPRQKAAAQAQNAVFILTGQYTNEEYQALAEAFPRSSFYHWLNDKGPGGETWSREDFDGLLLRGDRNPNTAGLEKHFPKIKPWKDFEALSPDSRPLFALGPENQNFYPDLKEKTAVFSRWSRVVWMAPGENPALPPKEGFWQIPLLSSFEKEGSYISAKGLVQKIEPVQTLAPQALALQSCLSFFEKGALEKTRAPSRPYFKSNQFLSRAEKLWQRPL